MKLCGLSLKVENFVLGDFRENLDLTTLGREKVCGTRSTLRCPLSVAGCGWLIDYLNPCCSITGCTLAPPTSWLVPDLDTCERLKNRVGGAGVLQGFSAFANDDWFNRVIITKRARVHRWQNINKRGVVRLIDRFLIGLIDWSVARSIDDWVSGCHLIDWSVGLSFDRPFDWLIEWLVCHSIDYSIDWLIGLSFDWPVDWSI